MQARRGTRTDSHGVSKLRRPATVPSDGAQQPTVERVGLQRTDTQLTHTLTHLTLLLTYLTGLPAIELEGLQPVIAHVRHPYTRPCHCEPTRLVEGAWLRPGVACVLNAAESATLA